MIQDTARFDIGDPNSPRAIHPCGDKPSVGAKTGLHITTVKLKRFQSLERLDLPYLEPAAIRADGQQLAIPTEGQSRGVTACSMEGSLSAASIQIPERDHVPVACCETLAVRADSQRESPVLSERPRYRFRRQVYDKDGRAGIWADGYGLRHTSPIGTEGIMRVDIVA